MNYTFRIKIAIELIEEGSIAVGDMMSTLFFPIIPFLMEVIFVAWFVTVAAFLSSWNEQVRTYFQNSVTTRLQIYEVFNVDIF